MCLVRVFIFIKKADHMYEIFFLKSGQHREERRDEMTVQRRGDKLKKKADQWVHQQSKKLSKRVQVYCVIAIRNVCSLFKITSGHISKHIVQTLVFRQQFPNNSILN